MTPELEKRIKEKIKTDPNFRRTLQSYISTLRTYPPIDNEEALFEYTSRNETSLLANASRAEKMSNSLDIPVQESINFVVWLVNHKEELDRLVKESSIPWWKRMLGFRYWRKLYDQGNRSLRKGNLEEARRLWENAKKSAESTRASEAELLSMVIQLGQLCLLQTDYGCAEEHFLECELLLQNLKGASEYKEYASSLNTLKHEFRHETIRREEVPELKTKRQDVANTYIRRWFSMAPTDPSPALNNIAISFRHIGETKWAIAMLNFAVARNPDDPTYLNNLGDILRQDLRRNEAIEALWKSVELRPNDPSTLNNFGFALRVNGNLHESIEVLTKSLKLRPDHPQTLNNLALAHIGNNEETLARKIFVELLDSEDLAMGFYARLLTGQMAEVEQSFQQILSMPTMGLVAKCELRDDLDYLSAHGYIEAENVLPILRDDLETSAFSFMAPSSVERHITKWFESHTS